MTAKKFLQQRLEQLKNRKTGIEIYLGNINKDLIAGFRQYKQEDLTKVKNEIEETKAAISGIKQWELKNKFACLKS